jgi:hypothetical protein
LPDHLEGLDPTVLELEPLWRPRVGYPAADDGIWILHKSSHNKSSGLLLPDECLLGIEVKGVVDNIGSVLDHFLAACCFTFRFRRMIVELLTTR